jgi:RNA polymerase sigma factor (sigma-70 family)
MNELLQQIGSNADETIARQVVAGDTALFEILIRRYNPVLYKIARSFDFNHQDAEDLMQETHLAAYQHLAQFEGKAAYKTWLSRIMVNKCLYKRKYGPGKNEKPAGASASLPVQVNPSPLQPEASVLNKELAAILENSLRQIPVLYRTVFVLREIEGLSTAETAEISGLTPTNVKVRLNRARALLQKEIERTYSRSEIYSFNLVYCDAIVSKVFARIKAGGPG